ncbi:MAG: hypothetical protein BGO82_13560 [Devosia sp. 67-54]|uniref:hypothetical protein n=1 Tax=unclassified Devosia TaxID=196773 RepID=UPI00095D4FE6|nr:MULTISPECIES: hypothetical protein [unclassified Devosia]MBN9306645.1 hypothetical protein [Devosia sp.]OJX15920.1 MAG: hypothetical protein BGO82_13560 [Devosia sp. 67-54]
MRCSRFAPALAAALVLAAPALAFDGTTKPIGGPGGSRYLDECRPGDALVAIDYKAGKDMDMVTGACVALHDGWPTGKHYRLATRGLDNDNGRFNPDGTIVCPRRMVVQQIHVTESAVGLVHSFWLTCRNLPAPGLGDSKATKSNGGAGGSPGSADCGPDSYARGLLIRGDARINALGLICATYRPPPPPPQPPQPATPADPPPFAIDNDVHAPFVITNG